MIKNFKKRSMAVQIVHDYIERKIDAQERIQVRLHNDNTPHRETYEGIVKRIQLDLAAFAAVHDAVIVWPGLRPIFKVEQNNQLFEYAMFRDVIACCMGYRNFNDLLEEENEKIKS